MSEPSASSFLRPAFLTAMLAALLSISVAAAFVLVASGSADVSVIGIVRSTIRTWLVAMGSGIDAGTLSLGLVPLGATLVCVLVVARAAAWVVSEPVDEIAAFAATTAGAYGVIAGIASAATNSGDLTTSVVRAAFSAFAVGGLGAAIGASRRRDAGDGLWFTTDRDVTAIVRAAVPASLAVIAVAGVIVTLLLVSHLDRAADLWAVLDPETGGGIALAVACLLAVPTLVLWTVSVLIGPGFALGVDTTVDLTGSQLGGVPSLPVLAALPSPGQFPEWVFLLGLVPLAAGMLAGWRVDPGPREHVLARMGLGVAAGGLAGLALGLLVAVSGGAVGPGRMAEAGPPMVTPLLVAIPVMAVGGALGAVLAHYRGGRATQLTDASSPGGSRLWRRHQSASTDRRVGRP